MVHDPDGNALPLSEHHVRQVPSNAVVEVRHISGGIPQGQRLQLMSYSMIDVEALFETHLPVADLQRSMTFYGATLGLTLANVLWDRKVASYWIGGRGKSMLGLWEVGSGPQRMSLHLALRTDLSSILKAPARLRDASIEPLDFDQQSTDEPVVLSWMPAASLYFRDPDGHSLEFLAMLRDSPEPHLGVVRWSQWCNR